MSIRKFPAVKYHGHRFYSVYPIPGVCDKSNHENNFSRSYAIGFVILMCFQHFINSSLPFPIYEIIFYADSVYPICWKNFVFINFSNIQDKTGKEFLFISWQYHGNLSVSLKMRKMLCIQNLPYQKD